MSRHLRSAPDGLARVGLWRLVGITVLVWLLPMPLGLLGQVVSFAFSGETALAIYFSGLALVVSPAFSWIGWLIATPLVALALRLGWFGWLVAALIGAFAGWLAGQIAQTDLAGGFGLVSVVVLRLALGWFIPQAFDPGPGC